MSCFAMAFEGSTGKGDPAEKETIRANALLEAWGKLAAALEMEATKQCPDGHRCLGVTRFAGPPVLLEGVRTEDGRPVYSCLVTWSGVYEGECRDLRQNEARETADGPEGPLRRIEADGLSAFFHMVAKLPELPVHAEGPCRLYRHQPGHGFAYPICAGQCATGRCHTEVTAIGDRFVAQCSCG